MHVSLCGRACGEKRLRAAERRCAPPGAAARRCEQPGAARGSGRLLGWSDKLGFALKRAGAHGHGPQKGRLALCLAALPGWASDRLPAPSSPASGLKKRRRAKSPVDCQAVSTEGSRCKGQAAALHPKLDVPLSGTAM